MPSPPVKMLPYWLIDWSSTYTLRMVTLQRRQVQQPCIFFPCSTVTFFHLSAALYPFQPLFSVMQQPNFNKCQDFCTFIKYHELLKAPSWNSSYTKANLTFQCKLVLQLNAVNADESTPLMPSVVPMVVLIDTLSQSLLGGKGTENIETLQERKT